MASNGLLLASYDLYWPLMASNGLLLASASYDL